ncbi:MAG: hypothetical protein KDB35_20850 [Acidimicrobiales bacterium]|nr:hypothetical protein [Acidimicrobiales bacterium]
MRVVMDVGIAATVTGDRGRRVKPGGERSNAEIFESLYPSLRRFAAMCAPLSVEPDDLLQEAVARTLRAGPLRELDNPAGYLRVAIVNIAKNLYRVEARRELSGVVEEVAEDDYPSDLGVLDELNAIERAAVYLVDVEGYSYRAAARTVGCSVPALRSRLARARRHIRNAYKLESTQ